MSKSPEEMTDEELLERIAAEDPEQIPLAKHCQRALQNEE
jgi:hypothetical protein